MADVIVRIFVDTAIAMQGCTKGLYMVDNRAPRSQNEGTASLTTFYTLGNKIKWIVKRIVYGTKDTVKITSFGDCQAWGDGGHPKPVNKKGTVWTGRVGKRGQFQYSLTLLIKQQGGETRNVSLSPSLSDSSVRQRGQAMNARSSVRPKAQCSVLIVVDTAQVIGGDIRPIYMMDNRVELGSSGEGTNRLNTYCYPGDRISWWAMPLDYGTGDKVVINGFEMSQDNVFNVDGVPKPVSPQDRGYWMGRAINRGAQKYKIKLLINDTYAVYWDGPGITCS